MGYSFKSLRELTGVIAGIMEKQIIFCVDAPMEGRLQMTCTSTVTKGLQGTYGNGRKYQKGDRVTLGKRKGGMTHNGETREDRRKRANAAVCIKPSTARVDCHFGKDKP
jgi:hypothetical protein